MLQGALIDVMAEALAFQIHLNDACRTGLANGQPRQADRFQPAQHAQLGFRVTQPIEDHDARQRFDIDGVARASKHTTHAVETGFLPQFRQRPYIAERTGLFERHGRFGGGVRYRAARDSQRPVDHTVHAVAELTDRRAPPRPPGPHPAPPANRLMGI